MSITTNNVYFIRSYAGGLNMPVLNVYGNETVTEQNRVCLWEKVSVANSQDWKINLVSGTTNKYQIGTILNTSFKICYESDGSCKMRSNIPTPKYSHVAIELQSATQSLYKIRLYDQISGVYKYLTAAGTANNSSVTWANAVSTGNTQIWQFVTNSKPSGNYAQYPCKVMNISQSYTGTYSHLPNRTGTPSDYPFDETCDNTGRSYMYCPCDEMIVLRIHGVGDSGTNTIWLRSTAPVKMPYGTDYLVMMVIHPEDDDLSQISVGQKFKRGNSMFREGKDGLATGYHFHISMGLGNITGTGWVQNSAGAWVITTTGGAIKPEQAFYLDTSFTSITNNSSLAFSAF